MSEDFPPGKYKATVRGTEWIVSSGGTKGLRVDVDVVNDAGVTKAMSGKIWCTKVAKDGGPGTLIGKWKDDGTLGRGIAERQLNAIGYRGPLANADAIGETIHLAANPVQVELD